jgi:hypothetical protein
MLLIIPSGLHLLDEARKVRVNVGQTEISFRDRP